MDWYFPDIYGLLSQNEETVSGNAGAYQVPFPGMQRYYSGFLPMNTSPDDYREYVVQLDHSGKPVR